jgi:1-acyl-sn-glycerol-3-phosphate acyltransferase
MRFQKTMFRVWCFVFRLFTKLLFRAEVHHQSELLGEGPLIIATNHFHLLDPVLVVAGVPYEYVTILVAEKWEQIWPINWIVRSFGGVFVRRGEFDRGALEKCTTALRKGGIVGLAPEGTRSRSGVLQRGKPGVAYMALKANAPILPVGVSGQDRIASDWKRLRRPHIVVRVGEPFFLEPVHGRHKGEQLQARSDEVMCHISDLIREDLRGVYSDSTCLAESTA